MREGTVLYGSVWFCLFAACVNQISSFRVQPGQCFHLFTEFQAQKMIDYQLPEMLRTPLEELCLQIKVIYQHYSH